MADKIVCTPGEYQVKKETLEALNKELELLRKSELRNYDSMRMHIWNRIDELNTEIDLLTKEFSNLKVIYPPAPKSIGLNSYVKLRNLLDHSYLDIMIVPSNESDPRYGKISILAPKAQLLLSKKAGDVVSFGKRCDSSTNYKTVDIKVEILSVN